MRQSESFARWHSEQLANDRRILATLSHPLRRQLALIARREVSRETVEEIRAAIQQGGKS